MLQVFGVLPCRPIRQCSINARRVTLQAPVHLFWNSLQEGREYLVIRSMSDVVVGGLLLGLGIYVAAHAQAYLPMGTLQRMGPGMYPFALGIILSCLGAVICAMALTGPRRDPIPLQVRPFVFVLTAFLVFAALVRPLGLFPALFVMTLIATRAEGRPGPLGSVILAIAISTLAVLLFRVALGLPFAAFVWPIRGLW